MIPISYDDVVIDLMKHGFTETYTTWIYHSESEVTQGVDVAEHYDDLYLSNLSTALNSSLNQDTSVVPDSFYNTSETVELKKFASGKAISEDPAIEFNKVVQDAMTTLYPRCKGFTVLTFVVILYKLKVKHNWSKISFTELLQWLLLPYNVDVNTATKYRVSIGNTPGALTETTAELTASLSLGAARRILVVDEFMRAGLYDGWLPHLFVRNLLKGQTVGVMGAGRIGSAYARMMVFFALRNRQVKDSFSNPIVSQCILTPMRFTTLLNYKR
ncbi:hypothetical protein GIB67_039505 [Kingdonia uniflora]|uniref:D-isomer specific 2-hydroxyacid dehydrogenase NAD-binding domain-containing protein n=1 Tax=Kingdonia uniflora TaxID=39325 RepID=A0A7J7LIN8_9MAGN|nr:hypothetical protein GIB67_039505 [Kingdonia uniflora]